MDILGGMAANFKRRVRHILQQSGKRNGGSFEFV